MDGSAFLAALSSRSTSDNNSKAAGSTAGHEYIHFSGDVETFPVKEAEVTISSASSGDHESASTNLKLNSMVNFSWPHEYMPGQLVAVNRGNTFLAYGIITPGKSDAGGAVRVIQRKTEERTLLKGMQGKIKDLAFAHTPREVIVGCVDEFGNLFVFEIKENSDSSLQTDLVVHIKGHDKKKPGPNSDFHRLIWCPYLPEEGDDEDSEGISKLLVVTHNSIAEMWNVEMVTEEYGVGPHDPNSLVIGRLTISDHESAITDATFSPDGTALATASKDGMVKFFQVYMPSSGESPRCLHEWAPHEGESVSSLFFLDNHRDHVPDVQFWKYAVTGCNQNSELKIWSCETWTCLQRIEFKPSDGRPAVMKCALDLSAKFLLLSDIYRKIIYALQFQENNEQMRVVTVSEFATPFPFLCMSIFDAGVRKITTGQNTLNEEEVDHDDTFEDDILEDDEEERAKWTRETTVIELVLVQPKSLQNCTVIFDDALKVLSSLKIEDGATPIKQEINVSSVKQELNIKVEKSPVHIKTEKNDLNGSQLNEAAEKITLLSPDAFSSLSSTPRIKVKTEPSGEDLVDEILLAPNEIKRDLKNFMRSGNSSPSGEVQDILGDSEEQGGLGSDIVVTEEPYEDEDDEIEEDDDDILEIQDVKPTITERNFNASDPLGNLSSSSFADQTPPKILSKSMDWPGVPNIKSEPGAVSKGATGAKTVIPQEKNPSLDLLLRKMNEMTNMMVMQKSEIQSLRNEIHQMRKEEKSTLENMAKRNGQQVAEALKRDGKARNDSLLSGLNQTVTSTISHKVENVMRAEIKKLAPQIIQQTLQGVTVVLEQDVRNKVTKSDQMLKESLGKLVNSRQVSDTLARAISSNVQTVMRGSFKDVIANVLIPAFERALQAMLGQVSQGLNSGVKEHETMLIGHMQKIRKEQTDKLIQPILSEIREKLNDTVLTQRIVASVRDVVTNELRQGIRSISNTPTVAGIETGKPTGNGAPPSFEELTQQVRSTLAQGRYNDAFQTALVAHNLPLVELTCEMVNCTQMFSQTPCPLSQSTLLSLIQQLGTNLENKTELKHDYIREAVMSLNPSDPIIINHKTAILGGLRNQLETYIRQHPNQKMTKQMKMLDMATASVINA